MRRERKQFKVEVPEENCDWIYLLFDEAESCLYIGSTCRPRQRMIRHSNYSLFWGEVVRAEWRRPGEGGRYAEEAQAIREFRPSYNKRSKEPTRYEERRGTAFASHGNTRRR